jgi:hypothetical protein
LTCSIVTSANAERIIAALPPAALKQAQYLLREASWLQISWHLPHASTEYAKIAQVVAVELVLQCLFI